MVLCCILEKLCDWKFDLDLLKTCLNLLKVWLDDKKGLILLPVRFLISIICDIIELIVVATEYGLTFWQPEAFWIIVFFIIWCLSFLVFLFVYAIMRRKTDEETIESEKRCNVIDKASSFVQEAKLKEFKLLPKKTTQASATQASVTQVSASTSHENTQVPTFQELQKKITLHESTIKYLRETLTELQECYVSKGQMIERLEQELSEYRNKYGIIDSWE
jgi:hypothetical protein